MSITLAEDDIDKVKLFKRNSTMFCVTVSVLLLIFLCLYDLDAVSVIALLSSLVILFLVIFARRLFLRSLAFLQDKNNSNRVTEKIKSYSLALVISNSIFSLGALMFGVTVAHFDQTVTPWNIHPGAILLDIYFGAQLLLLFRTLFFIKDLLTNVKNSKILQMSRVDFSPASSTPQTS